MIPIHIKIVLNLFSTEFIFNMAQQNKVARMENMPICIHLSSHILSNQFSFGNAEPGNVSNMTEMMNQAMAGKKDGLILFNE